MNVHIAQNLLLYGVLCLAVIGDFYRMKISNRLIIVGLLLSLGFRVSTEGAGAVPVVLWNISFPVIVLYVFYLLGAIAAGDVKLFSVIGGFLHFYELMMCIVVSFLIAALFSLGKMVCYHRFSSGIKEGAKYLWGRLKGEQRVYERDFSNKTNLIHFSFAILLGTAAVELYLGGWH